MVSEQRPRTGPTEYRVITTKDRELQSNFVSAVNPKVVFDTHQTSPRLQLDHLQRVPGIFGSRSVLDVLDRSIERFAVTGEKQFEVFTGPVDVGKTTKLIRSLDLIESEFAHRPLIALKRPSITVVTFEDAQDIAKEVYKKDKWVATSIQNNFEDFDPEHISGTYSAGDYSVATGIFRNALIHAVQEHDFVMVETVATTGYEFFDKKTGQSKRAGFDRGTTALRDIAAEVAGQNYSVNIVALTTTRELFRSNLISRANQGGNFGPGGTVRGTFAALLDIKKSVMLWHENVADTSPYNEFYVEQLSHHNDDLLFSTLGSDIFPWYVGNYLQIPPENAFIGLNTPTQVDPSRNQEIFDRYSYINNLSAERSKQLVIEVFPTAA